MQVRSTIRIMCTLISWYFDKVHCWNTTANRRQTIIWNNGDRIMWHNMVPLDLNELIIHTNSMHLQDGEMW